MSNRTNIFILVISLQPQRQLRYIGFLLLISSQIQKSSATNKRDTSQNRHNHNNYCHFNYRIATRPTIHINIVAQIYKKAYAYYRESSSGSCSIFIPNLSKTICTISSRIAAKSSYPVAESFTSTNAFFS